MAKSRYGWRGSTPYYDGSGKGLKPGTIIGVAAVAAGAGLALWYLLKGGSRFDGTVQYAADADAEAAQLVRDGLKPMKFVNGYVDPFGISKPLIIVGGGQANPTYSILQSSGVMPEITIGMAGKGLIFVRSVNGFPVYAVVGWSKADTLKAAQFIKNLKGHLPAADVQV